MGFRHRFSLFQVDVHTASRRWAYRSNCQEGINRVPSNVRGGPGCIRVLDLVVKIEGHGDTQTATEPPRRPRCRDNTARERRKHPKENAAPPECAGRRKEPRWFGSARHAPASQPRPEATTRAGCAKLPGAFSQGSSCPGHRRPLARPSCVASDVRARLGRPGHGTPWPCAALME